MFASIYFDGPSTPVPPTVPRFEKQSTAPRQTRPTRGIWNIEGRRVCELIQPSKGTQHAQFRRDRGHGKLFICPTAMAQPANPDARTPAAFGTAPAQSGRASCGANSFTEGQAKSRFDERLPNVNELRKDDKGVWRGKAMKDGRSVSVSFDFRATSLPSKTRKTPKQKDLIMTVPFHVSTAVTPKRGSRQ
jgi:hypothetical protein